MDVTPYVASLREDLLAAAAAGDEQTRRTAELLATAIEPAARLALLHALADLTGEVTEALDDGRTVEVRLDGRQVRVAVSEPDRPRAEPPAAGPSRAAPFGSPFGADAGDVSRITLRLMEQLKSNAEQAASAQGMSLNSWISQAVQGALSGSRSGGWDKGHGWDKRDRSRGGDDNPGNRLRGWVQG
jgi:uncharacterized protein (DUF1778 family)